MPRPIRPRSNHDHFGFYKIGNHKTYSKLDAIEISAKTGIELEWVFNKDVFDTFNWKVEPPESLDFWYAERARQIRETYDYIVLMYSGGPDSWNMLKAFVDNNIYVDEISHFILHSGTSLGLDAEQNYEVFKTSYPATKALIETNSTYKTTKHRIVDGGDTLVKTMSTADPFDYFYQEGNFFFGPWGTVIGDIRETDPEYKKLIDQKKSVCFVWGYDKPLITVSNDKFYVRFSEMGASTFVKPKHQAQNVESKFDEAFYWSPDMPEITCKQAHVLKKYIEHVNVDSIDGFYLNGQNPLIKNDSYKIKFNKNKQSYELSEHGVHRLIYNNWDVNTIVCPKHKSPLLSPKDYWWTANNVPGSGNHWYLKGIFNLQQHIKKIHPKWWVEFESNLPGRNRFRGSIRPCEISYSLN